MKRRTSLRRAVGAGTAAVVAAAAGLLLTPDANAIISKGSAWGEVVGDEDVPIIDGLAANTPLWVVRIGGCSGVAVEGYWVLTARHCLPASVRDENAPEPADQTLSFADPPDLTVWGMDAFGTRIEFTPTRVYWRSDNDIALVELDREFRLSVEQGYERRIGVELPSGDRAKVEGRGVIYGYGDSPEDEWVGGGGVLFEPYTFDEDYGAGATFATTPAAITVRYESSRVQYEPGTLEDGDSGGPLIVDGVVEGINTSTVSARSPTGDIYDIDRVCRVWFQLEWIRAEIDT